MMVEQFVCVVCGRTDQGIAAVPDLYPAHQQDTSSAYWWGDGWYWYGDGETFAATCSIQCRDILGARERRH